MSQVLAAVDDGPCSSAVLTGANAIAALFGATVDVVHVRDAEEIVSAAAGPGVTALVLPAVPLHDGPPREDHAALEIVTRITKPVLLVPPDCTIPPVMTRILVPLEGTDVSSSAIADTLALTRGRDIDVVVVHVHGPQAIPPFRDHPRHDIPAWQRDFAARFVTVPGLRLEVLERVGAAAEHIVAVAHEVQADLILLGWSRRLTPGRARVVRETLATSDVAVLLVPVP